MPKCGYSYCIPTDRPSFILKPTQIVKMLCVKQDNVTTEIHQSASSSCLLYDDHKNTQQTDDRNEWRRRLDAYYCSK